MTTHTTKANENVFESMGFSKEEAAEMELRTFIAYEIRVFIERQGLTQQKAAEFFGTTQPKISKIINGHGEGFTINALVRLLARTGGKFQYAFKQPRKKAA